MFLKKYKDFIILENYQKTYNNIIAYHGTNNKFTIFDDIKPIFFVDNINIAKTYGRFIIKAKLTIKNPIIFDFEDKSTCYFFDKWYSPSDLTNKIKEISDDIKNFNYLDDELRDELEYFGFSDAYGNLDGIIMENIKDSFDGVFSTFESATNFVIFDKNQISIIH